MNSRSLAAALIIFLVPTFISTALANKQRRRRLRRRAGLFLSVARGKVETSDASWGMRLFVRKEIVDGEKTETLEARGPLRIARHRFLVKDITLGLDTKDVEVNEETKEKLVVTSISGTLYKRDKEAGSGITAVGSINLTVDLETIDDKELPRVSGTVSLEANEDKGFEAKEVSLSDGKIRFDGALYQQAFGEFASTDEEVEATEEETEVEVSEGEEELEVELTDPTAGM